MNVRTGFAWQACAGKVARLIAAVAVVVAPTPASAYGAQTLAWGATPSVTVGTSGSTTVSSTSGLTPAIGNLTPTVCSFVSNGAKPGTVSVAVTGLAAGTCSLEATQSGNAMWNPAPPVTLSITVGKGYQTMSISTRGRYGNSWSNLGVGGTGPLLASATSGLAVYFAATTTAICKVSNNTTSGGWLLVPGEGTVWGLSPGTCTITAYQSGDANYNPVQATLDIPVKYYQTITLGTWASMVVGGVDKLGATATSGLAVTFATTSPRSARSPAARSLHWRPAAAHITVDQAGDANYYPAPQA